VSSNSVSRVMSCLKETSLPIMKLVNRARRRSSSLNRSTKVWMSLHISVPLIPDVLSLFFASAGLTASPLVKVPSFISRSLMLRKLWGCRLPSRSFVNDAKSWSKVGSLFFSCSARSLLCLSSRSKRLQKHASLISWSCGKIPLRSFVGTTACRLATPPTRGISSFLTWIAERAMAAISGASGLVCGRGPGLGVNSGLGPLGNPNWGVSIGC